MNKRNPKKPDNKYDDILQKSLEEQNEHKIDVLLQNVNELKQIGLDLNEDISEEKPILNTIGSHFDGISSSLRQTMNKIDLLMVYRTNKIVGGIVGVAVLLFIALHFLYKK